jgi:hypothetical protein
MEIHAPISQTNNDMPAAKDYTLQTGTFTKDENHAPLDVQLFDAMFNIRNLIHLMTTCFCSSSVLIQIGNFQEFGVHYC